MGAVVIAAVLLLLALPASAAAATYPHAPRYEVGVAERSINPDADGSWRGEAVNLGRPALSALRRAPARRRR